MGTIYVDIEVDSDQILDAMDQSDKEELTQEMDIEEIRSKISYELDPGPVVAVLKQKKINLKKLYDYLSFYYMKKEG